MNKKSQNLILIAFAIVGLYYGYIHRDLFENLRKITPYNLIALIVASIIFQLINGYKFKFLMSVFNVKLPLKEWLGLSICNTMFNYYLPARGGIAIRAYYLKRKYRFSYSYYSSLIAGSFAIVFLVSGFVGLGATIYYGYFHQIVHVELIMIFLVLIVLTATCLIVLSLFFNIGKAIKYRRIYKILEMIKEGLLYFRNDRKSVILYSFLHVATIFIFSLRLLVCFYTVDIDVLASQMVIIASLTTFSMIISVTPSNLGIQEGIISFSAHLLGISLDSAIIAALIDRGVSIALTFLLGMYFSRILLGDSVFDAKQ